MKECRGALEGSEKFEEYRATKGCFRSWFMATDKLSAVVDTVQNAFNSHTLPNKAEIQFMKSMWEECMALRSGTEQNEAWQLCWDIVINRY